jgi:hypothetical protein
MLPNAAQAIVEPSKVRDYLLSKAHSVGRFKAIFFLALGCSSDNWQVLAQDLLALAAGEPAREGQFSPYGQKYEVSW